MHSRAVVLSAAMLPIVLNVIGIAYLSGRRRLKRDPVGRRRRRALKLARQKLKQAQDKLDAQQPALFSQCVDAAMLGYLADRFNLPSHGMTRAQIRTLLVDSGCEAALVTGVRKLLDRCDYYRFTPGRAQRRDLAQLLREAQAIIKVLDRRLSGKLK